MKRRPVHAHLLAALLVGSAAASGALVLPAAAAGLPACPDPLPVEDAVDGVLGTGLTVERGTEPTPFDAVVLGRIDDGIAAGVDMIIAELSSPAIQRAGGVWSGMSGSPVYAEDGRLIGAVSYVLAAGSPIAGITPAESMLELLDDGAPPAGLEGARVAPPAPLAAEIAATGEATSSQARAGFAPMTVPVQASVGTSRSAQLMLGRLRGDLPGTRVQAGGATVKANAVAQDIVPGSNYAAALSYGDVTLAGIGTTTLVCDGTAVAFGHPLLDTGPTTLSTHGASAVFVQPDPVFGAFKVANPGAVVGTVTSDSRVGIAGPLGTAPESTPVTASFTSPNGVVRTGSSQAVLGEITPDVAALQAVSTIERAYGAAAAGTVRFTLKVTVERADGSTTVVTRKDVASSSSALARGPVAFVVADEVYRTVLELQDQELEDVRIAAVDISGSVSTTHSALRLRTVERRQVSAFRPMTDYTRLAAGTPLQVRVGLSPTGSSAISRTTLTIPTPRDAAGGFGSVDLVAGEEAAFVVEPVEPETYDQLVDQVKKRPGRASISVLLTYERADGTVGQTLVTSTTATQVQNIYRSYAVEFV